MITINIQCSGCGRSLTIYSFPESHRFEAMEAYKRHLVAEWLRDPDVKHYCTKKCWNRWGKKGHIFPKEQ